MNRINTSRSWLQRSIWGAALLLLGLLLSSCRFAGSGGGSTEPREEAQREVLVDSCVAAIAIGNQVELEAMQDDPSKNYCLKNSITLDGNWTPLATFMGTLDGKGHVISGLIIKDTTNNVGFFRELEVDATVKDLILDAPSVVGNNAVGGLVGINNGGTITNSYARGATVKGAENVGGLVGQMSSGTITNSYATGNVNGTTRVGGLVGDNKGTITSSYATGNVNGATRVGGLVGYNYGTIRNSYATGNVDGKSTPGGLVGRNERGAIENSYARGTVTVAYALASVGGLVGLMSGGSIKASYYDKESTRQRDTEKGVGVSAARNIVQLSDEYYDRSEESTLRQIFVDWDFTSAWKWKGDGEWPILAWQ